MELRVPLMLHCLSQSWTSYLLTAVLGKQCFYTLSYKLRHVITYAKLEKLSRFQGLSKEMLMINFLVLKIKHHTMLWEVLTEGTDK